MAEIVVDELVTRLSYEYDAAAIKAAETAVKKLEQQNKLAAQATDKLGDEQKALAQQTAALARAQLDLAGELADTASKADKLRAEQKALQEVTQGAGRATDEQKKRLRELYFELQATERHAKGLREESGRLAREKQAAGLQAQALARAQTEVSRTARQATADQRALAAALRQTKKDGDNVTRFVEAQARGAQKSLDAQRGRTDASRHRLSMLQGTEAPTLGDVSGRVQGLAGGAAATIAPAAAVLGGAATGVGLLGAKVIEVGTSFESLRARLKTVEGSVQGADQAFALIQKFAATTPYQIEEVTTAFVRLKSLGLDASEESLKAFGNLAAAQGKPMIEFIEAVADASTGEFERLKEFGIKASSQGDKVAFTFKGVTTTVGKNADEIQAFLKGIGETEFAGAMADQMATTAGAISNLQDTVAAFFDQVAQLGVLDEFKLLLGDISGLAGDGGLAQVVADVLVSALRGLREAIRNITAEDIAAFFEGVKASVGLLVDGLTAALDAFKWLTSFMGNDTAAALEVVALGMGAIVMALTGPAGIVVAAGLAGAAIGEMIGELMFGLDEVERRRSKLQAEQWQELKDREEKLDEFYADMEAEQAAQKAATKAKLDAASKVVQSNIGGLGKGLAKQDAMQHEYDPLYYAAQLQAGGARGEKAREVLLTREGRVVADAVAKHEADRISKAEQTARQEARKRGSDQDAAAAAAREAVQASNESSRRKAFETAQRTFEQTGSAEAAAAAAVGESGKVKGAKAPKGRKGPKAKSEDLLTEDVAKQIEKLAKDAGRRKAARASLAGERDQATLDEIERAERKAVQSRLTTQFGETGTLPPGLATDLVQAARIPNLEETGGRLAPPVISVVNNKYDIKITGNEFVAQVTVDGPMSGTPSGVAQTIGTDAMPVTFKQLGMTLQNMLTNER